MWVHAVLYFYYLLLLKTTNLLLIMAQALVSLSEGIVSEPAPLEFTTDGVIRIGKTRVTLDTVITVFQQGTTAEEIAYRYPSLKLADIYATIAFYLNHQQEVEVYLQQRQQQAQEIRRMNEARFDPQGLRDRLLARKAEREVC
jgi:uncharacterized protein (DUF433 family)